MASIKVVCGFNNTTSSRREFEIDSIGLDINEFSEDTIAYNAALLGIIGICYDIHYCCSERIGDTIAIAPSYIKDECFSLVNLVRCIRQYEADAFNNVFKTPLYLVKAVNAHFFKTKIEEVYLAEKYDVFETVIKKLMTTALDYISRVFHEGITSVSNKDNNRLVYVPTSDLISLLGVTEDELFHGVRLRCENREVIIESQNFRDIFADVMLVSKVSSHDDDDDREIILTNSITKGIATAMLYDD